MLYFDNAATSFPKPFSVRKSFEHAMLYYGANPGRSGHRMGMETSRMIYACREKAASLFGLSNSENVVFTKNCTEAINTVLMSTAFYGGEVIISDLEHNSVLRPLYELKNRGVISFFVAETYENDPEKTVKSYEDLITENTKLIVATAASNVFGIKLPIEMLGKLAFEHGIPFMVDAAQTAGAQKINADKININFLCAPGHKGLLGPMGTGLLLTKKPELLTPMLYGGTGSYSLVPAQPEELPDMLESGTLNTPGICALSAGIDEVLKRGEENIAEKEAELAKFIYEELGKIPEITLYTQKPEKETHSPTLSFNLKDFTGEETAALLSEQDIAVRGGFHCSSLAHYKMGTENRGTCRISVGYSNSFSECEKLIKIIHSLTK